MANTGTTSDVWSLTDAATIKAAGVWVKVNLLRWYPNAVDNDLQVTDALGKVIWDVRAVIPAPNKESIGALEYKPEEGTYMNGFILATIDGGTLHVHVA